MNFRFRSHGSFVVCYYIITILVIILNHEGLYEDSLLGTMMRLSNHCEGLVLKKLFFCVLLRVLTCILKILLYDRVEKFLSVPEGKLISETTSVSSSGN